MPEPWIAASNGALVFSAWWNLVTLLLLLPVLFIKCKTVQVGLFNVNVNFYVFTVLIAFVAISTYFYCPSQG